jgi:hypothetical protein
LRQRRHIASTAAKSHGSAIAQRCCSAMLIAKRIAIAQRNPRAGTPPSQLRSMILQGLGRHGSSGVRSPAELIQVHRV